MARRRRDLADHERELWKKVTDSVAPLEAVVKRRRARTVKARATVNEGLAEPAHDEAPVSAPTPTPPEKPRRRKMERAEPPAYSPPVDRPKPAIKPLVPIDTRTRRRLSRGSLAVEARIDLHGMTQSEAFPALVGFLRRAQADGVRIVIVITGKGRSSSEGRVFDPSERGVLRRLVPHWLALPECRGLVGGYEEAGPTHGGAGALYVRLRKLAVIPKG